jgi:hypothetical protein
MNEERFAMQTATTTAQTMQHPRHDCSTPPEGITVAGRA